MIIHSATISSKSQITLPKRYRDDLHLVEGEEVLILRKDEGILIKHIKFTSMDIDSWEELLNLNLPKIHDRMICSIAIGNNADLITNDKEIKKRKHVNTILD